MNNFWIFEKLKEEKLKKKEKFIPLTLEIQDEEYIQKDNLEKEKENIIIIQL